MRAQGNDLCELFGYAPDDVSEPARRQWKARSCPFVGGECIKHGHPQNGEQPNIYGSCSVVNKIATKAPIATVPPRKSSAVKLKEEVIICPQRLYADNYATLKACAADAGITSDIYLADEYARRKKSKQLPSDYCVLLGRNSGREVTLCNPDVIELSLDWVIAYLVGPDVKLLVPCEVQSIDITGNYIANWKAYRDEKLEIPNSKHGMNWANVWKRLIPQLILKSSISLTSSLCHKGTYFVVPDRVYQQFERIVGPVQTQSMAGSGVLTVMTYHLGSEVPFGAIRSLRQARTERMLATDFAASFASGRQLPPGSQLDAQVRAILNSL